MQCIAAASLALAAASALAQSTSLVITGNEWMSASADERRAFLAGATNMIKRCTPVLIIEFVKTDKDKLRSALEAIDYGVFEFGMNFVAVHKSDKTINHVRVNQ